MTLEELSVLWQEQDRKLEQHLRLNRELLTAANLERVRTPIRRVKAQLCIEIATGALVLLAIGSFLGNHIQEPRFAWSAAVIHVWLIAFVAQSVRALVLARSIDFQLPVADIQRRLTHLRAFRIRAVRWQLLTGQIVWWIPFLAVLMKSFFDVDIFSILGPAYLVVNFGLGIALIPLSIWAAKRFEVHFSSSRFWSWLADEIAGRSLTEARRQAAMVSDFEQ